ncbi:ABC transporter permease [Streptomyces sp. AV19]|uniref:ABC transporter permease n=1 Tax=Streptomyces sp. AV19 TaxID=2793068 RepID=UPI0018FF06C8|nr:ABC transporter permease [Streptomyces sp. AV19]MBH1934585.1 ABC transporter permease [Streptomyces sp. AV19]MDG4530877.1 ABC transporter permease [Streptomyces sp. AV19]
MTGFRRMLALGRAELTLLGRNRMALYMALLMPALMAWAMRRSLGGIDGLDLAEAGTTVNETAMTAGFGFVLLFVVHQNLVSAYVARREELVLKRLRSGEARDPEILAGTALPAGLIAVAQCALLVVGGVAWLGIRSVARPDLLVAGLVLGIVLCATLAAATSAWARTVESAQLVTLPLFLVSLMGSGMVVPPELLPGTVASVCELLPLSPAVALLRGGWFGGMGSYEVLGHMATALAWVGVAMFAVQRWFRWEPRR